MQTANALLALSLGFAIFNYVDRLKKRAPKNQEAPFAYAADFVRKHKSSRIFSTTEYAHEPRCRSPPLLKFRVMVYQISEESEGPLLYTRYFRKKNPTCGTADVEWVEMSGEEFYSFVTAPENRNRYFVDMGDVVLECSKAEYKKFRAEDDHSSYILEQSTDWITLSLSELGDRAKCNGEELLPDETVDVCDLAIQNIRKRALLRALQQLSDDEYRMIMLRYHPRYAISEQKIGNLFALSQSGVSRRLTAIKYFLKKFVIESEKSSQ